MVGVAKAIVDEAVLGHAHEDACGGGDAGQGAGEHADESAEVNERTEEVDPSQIGQGTHGRGGVA